MELKLAVQAGSAGTILHHPAPRLSEPDAERRHQVITYFDTADHALAHSGITLQVCCYGAVHVQTVKADRRADLAADRAEWEWPIANDRPDMGLLAQTPVTDRLPASLDLQPVLATDITRARRTLTLDDGSQIKLHRRGHPQAGLHASHEPAKNAAAKGTALSGRGRLGA